MSTWIEAARAELKKAGGPLHYSVITSRALASSHIESEGMTPDQTMLSKITQSIEKGDNIFFRASRGIYGLREHSKGTTDKTRQDELSSRDKGAAGEHMVMAQLLLRGLHVYVPEVDTGIDMLCFKNDPLSTCYIQVKTSTKKSGYYQFNIGIKSYKKNESKNLIYVFVLLDVDSAKPKFVIMLKENIKKYIIETKSYHTINESKKEKFYAVKIYENKIKAHIVKLMYRRRLINPDGWGEIVDSFCDKPLTEGNVHNRSKN